MIKAMNTIPVTDDNGFLFNVDILVKSSSNALALQYLLEMLNDKAEVVDFGLSPEWNLEKLSTPWFKPRKIPLLVKPPRRWLLPLLR